MREWGTSFSANLPPPSPAEFSDRKRQMRMKIAEMVRRPGFPTDISFAEVGCFDEKLVRDLRNKIKELIDRWDFHSKC